MTKPNGKNSKDSSAVRVQCSTQLPIRQAQTSSQRLAEAVAHGTLTSATLHTYSQAGPALDIEDLAQQMHRAGAEVVKGDVGRVERLLTYQFLTLNEMFNNLAQRAKGQNNFKGIETLTRLAFKAQSQARATAETLSVMKNPQPYIKQANIAHGHQQVNNGVPVAAAAPTRAENSQSVPNELLEDRKNGIVMDTRAPRKASCVDTSVETMGTKHGPQK